MYCPRKFSNEASERIIYLNVYYMYVQQLNSNRYNHNNGNNNDNDNDKNDNNNDENNDFSKHHTLQTLSNTLFIKKTKKHMSGWWFGCHFLFSHILGS